MLQQICTKIMEVFRLRTAWRPRCQALNFKRWPYIYAAHFQYSASFYAANTRTMEVCQQRDRYSLLPQVTPRPRHARGTIQSKYRVSSCLCSRCSSASFPRSVTVELFPMRFSVSGETVIGPRLIFLRSQFGESDDFSSSFS